MNWIFFLVKKYLGFREKQRGLRLVIRLAIVGVALGVTTLTVSQAVLSGFEKAFLKSILGFNAHLVVLKEGEMRNLSEEQHRILPLLQSNSLSVTPFLYREGLFLAKGQVKGAVLKGIDPLTFQGVYDVNVRPWSDSQVPANIQELLKPRGALPRMILGADLAEELGVTGSAEPIKVFLPKQAGDGPVGEKDFQVFEASGTFSTGLYEFDHGFAFVDLASLQKVFGVTEVVSGLEFRLRDPMRADAVAQEIKNRLGLSYDAVSWKKLNGPLFKALRLERFAFFVVMSMVVAVAAFNIVGVLLLMIFQKSRDISILRAMGANLSGLKRVFGWQGLSIATVGCLGGLLLGGVLLQILKRSGWFKIAKEVYLIGELPVDFSWTVMGSVAAAGLGISWLATQVAVARLKRVPLDL